MFGLWSSCPCACIAWIPPSSSRAGPPGGQGNRSVQCGLGTRAPGLPQVIGSGSVLSRGSGLRFVQDNCGRSIYQRTGVSFEGESPNPRHKRNGLNVGLRCLAASTEKATKEKVGNPLPNGATEEDAGYMRMAVQLARKAIGQTSPSPMVGCVIVKDGQIVGRGFHPKAGEPHVEVSSTMSISRVTDLFEINHWIGLDRAE